MRMGLPYADVLKLSEEELYLLTGLSDPFYGAERLMGQYGSLTLIVVTLGAEGCLFRMADKTTALPTYPVVTVDKTGAGDAFWGAFLCKVAKNPVCIKTWDTDTVESYLGWANASGALCTAGRGAIPSIPTAEQVEKLIEDNKL